MSYGFTGKITHGSGLKSKQQKINEWKNRNRRKVMPGYPIEKVFQTKEEVDLYLSGDKIICLLCGRSFKSLCSHLGIHGMDIQSYQEKYGLPFSKGICGVNTKKLLSENAKHMIEVGLWKPVEPEMLKKMRANCKVQPFQPYRKQVGAQNISKTKLISKKNLRQDRKKGTYVYWQEEDYYKILSLSEEHNLHPHEIIDKFKNIVPSLSQFVIRKKTDNEFKKKYYLVVDALSFEMQAKHGMLGNRFVQELKKLKSQNKSNREISELLNIHEVTIEKYISKNNIKKPIKTSCVNGHPYPEGKRRCQICNTEKTRKLHNRLPREIAAQTDAIKKCRKCGIEVLAKRYGSPYCESCRTESYYESQKKYFEKKRKVK